MPSAQRRLFLGAIDVGKQLTAAKRRRTVAIAKFGHLKLPDESQRFPETYIAVLLHGIKGPINTSSLRRLNNSPAAREALRQADVALRARLAEWLAETTQPGYLSVDALSWVLSVDHMRISRWHRNSLVASVQAEGRTYINVADLLAKSEWVLPTK